jgi:hypothetical protein
MTTTLDVLVIGDHASEDAATTLQARGHRVHRCHDPGDPAFPCAGLADPGACPLDGAIDVALLVRRGVQPRPLAEEDGVRCAMRAGIPVVEDGTDVLDPYADWITERVSSHRDLVAGCQAAAGRRFDPLRSLVRDRIARLVGTVDVDPPDVVCRIDAVGPDLEIDLTVPAVLDKRLQQAIAVRVLDAVHASGRTYGQVDVNVRGLSA